MRHKSIILVVVALLENCLLTNIINGEYIFPGPQALSWKHNGCGSLFDCFAMTLPVVLLFRDFLVQRNIGPTTPARTTPTTPARTTRTTPTTPARTTPTTAARTTRITPTTPARTTPTTLAPITTTPASACPPKYSLFEESCGRFCYRYESSVCQNWNTAQSACIAERGDLLVPSECNYQFFRDLARQNKDRCNGNVWLGAVGYPLKFNYSPLEGFEDFPNTFPFWGPLQPPALGILSCIEMSRNIDWRMNVIYCEKQNAFICQIFN